MERHEIVEELIKTNLAVRDFKEEDVPSDVILRILEVGRLAHSSKNTQPWRFVVVRDKAKLYEISRTTPTGAHIARASFAIALFTENAKLPEIDGARAMEDMILYAWSLGIGSCWITNFDEDRVKKLLKAPASWKLITVIPFGYPRNPKRLGRKRRKPLSELAYYEEYGRPVTALSEER